MKQMNLSEIKQSAKKMEQGAWVSENPFLPGVPLKVRAPYNTEYNALYAKLAAEHTEEQLKTDEVRQKIDTELLARTVLVDWGIADTPFSPETAIELLTDPEFPAFRRAVNYAGNNVARVGVDSLEDAAKN